MAYCVSTPVSYRVGVRIWVYLRDLWALSGAGVLEAIGVSGDAIQKSDTICAICVICGFFWVGFVIS